MLARPLEISGVEPAERDGSAFDALKAFYRAFNTKDLPGLVSNWLEDDRPVMNNPVGGIRQGWKSISDGYRTLFRGRAEIHVVFHDYSVAGGGDWQLFIGREKGHCKTEDTCLPLRFRTSRLFLREHGSWRQLHHHGSIEEPAMLADYQRIILGASS